MIFISIRKIPKNITINVHLILTLQTPFKYGQWALAEPHQTCNHLGVNSEHEQSYLTKSASFQWERNFFLPNLFVLPLQRLLNCKTNICNMWHAPVSGEMYFQISTKFSSVEYWVFLHWQFSQMNIRTFESKSNKKNTTNDWKMIVCVFECYRMKMTHNFVPHGSRCYANRKSCAA